MGNDEQNAQRSLTGQPATTQGPSGPDLRPGSGSNWDPEPDREAPPGALDKTQGEASGSNWDVEGDPAASDDLDRTGEGAHER